MNIEELARVLARAATEGIWDEVPQTRPWDWDIELAIRYALRRQLLILQAEKQRQMATPKRRRTWRKRGAK